MDKRFSHYFKSVIGFEYIDVYRVLTLFEVHSPPIQHAVKKLLCAGIRGAKDQRKDIEEAIVALNRALEMIREDEPPLTPEQVDQLTKV